MVELSILFGVHEDGELENDEYFDLFLHAPWGGARLGSQQRTRVTVIDAESTGAVAHHTTSVLHYEPTGDDGYSGLYDESWEGGETAHEGHGDDDYAGGIVVEAGTVQSGTLVAKDAMDELRGFGGDVFVAWVEVGGADIYGEGADFSEGEQLSLLSSPAFGAPSAVAAATAVTRVDDLGSGNYTINYQVCTDGRNRP